MQPQSQEAPKRILVIGATGGTGQATVRALRQQNYDVTAVSRSASRWVREAGLTGVQGIDGDVTLPGVLDTVMPGHDAVIVTLGIRENPLSVRLFGSQGTPQNVRSEGTRKVVEAMQRHGLRRLIVQSSYGVGTTRDRLGWADRALFALLLAPQIRDTEVQEAVVRSSGLDWVLVQPVHLTDEENDTVPFASRSGETRAMKIPRRGVARYMVETLERPEVARCVVSLSG